MRRLTSSSRRDDGVIAVVVAMLIGFGVILALGALTVDVGNINADRRQLQNGADAVALAVAQQCAKDGTCNPTDPDLQKLANANAATSVNRVSEIRRVDGQTPAVCGFGPGLAACPLLSVLNTSNLQECPAPTPALAAGVKFVRVYNETGKNAGTGSNILPYSFGAAIAGVGSGANQQACASVAWGPLGTHTASVPLTISLCMFDAMVAATGGAANLPGAPSGTWPGYGPGHVEAWPPASVELKEFTTKYAGTCANSNGHTANGSFGWLTSSLCSTSVTTGNWVNGDPGNNMQCDVAPYYGKKILVPIFDCIVSSNGDPGAPPLPADLCKIPTSGGTHIWYHISGWASFYLSGYRFPGNAQPSLRSGLGLDACSAPASCMSGWLTKLTLSGESLGGGSSGYGVNVLQNIG